MGGQSHWFLALYRRSKHVVIGVGHSKRHSLDPELGPYPFILMNLFMSLQAAFTAPVLMMSQNRQEERDRLDPHNDYLIIQKAEEEIRAIWAHLDAQNEALIEIHRLIADS